MQEPTPQAKAHSAQVIHYIKQKILTSNRRHITFADFMQAALYAPSLGYYNAACVKFGPQGDFITAPMLGELFATSLANQCSNILQDLGNVNILELGAGDGQLAAQLIKLLDGQFNQYLILEPSAELKARQQKLLLSGNNNALQQNNIVWLNTLPKNFKGIIIANEVLDAIPVHLFRIKNKQILERFVTLADDQFYFVDLPASNNLISKILKLPIAKNLSVCDDYFSEICLLMPGFIKSLYECMAYGAILLVDYGFLEKDYYHLERDTGTLMCHYQHYAHYDPFFYPGLQDITAHVDFSLVVKCATKYGMQVAEFCPLANFLINNNLQQEFAAKLQVANELQRYKLNQEISTLVSPSEMGELFKFLMLMKL